MIAPFAKILRFVAVPHYERSYAGGFDFNWDVRAGGFAPTFQVQSQDAEGDPWINVLAQPVVEPYVAGVGPLQLSFQGDGHFRLQVLNAAANNAVVTQSQPIDARYQLGRGDWLKYREMLRRERLQIERLSGEPAWLLRRIVYGTPCPACVNPITGDVTTSECAACYGTGYVGGYYPAFPLFVDWKKRPPGNTTTARTPNGASEVAASEVIVPAFPRVKFEDIVVDNATNERFNVQASEPVTFRAAPIKQKLGLSRLQPSHPVYQVPVPGL